MKQWEVYDFPFPSPQQKHAFVIVSNIFICATAKFKFVNGLICTTIVGNRVVLDYEVVIDTADGMDWRTAVACNVIFQLPKVEFAQVGRPRGTITIERRRQIVRVINQSFQFGGI